MNEEKPSKSERVVAAHDTFLKKKLVYLVEKTEEAWKDYTVLVAVRDVLRMRSWILGNGVFTGEQFAKAIKDFYAPCPRRDFDAAVCSWIARIERSFFETRRTTLVMEPRLLALLKIEDYGRAWIAKGDV